MTTESTARSPQAGRSTRVPPGTVMAPRPPTVLTLAPPTPDPDVLLVEALIPGQAIAVSGRIDASSVADLRESLRGAVDAGFGELEVDVSGLELGDATGLGALLGAHRHAVRSGRTLLLTNPAPRLRRLLCATRLVRVLRVREDLPA